MTENTKKHLEETKKSCTACKLFNNRTPTPVVSIPRATRCNEIITLDLKEWGAGKYRYILYIIDMFSRLTAGVFISQNGAGRHAWRGHLAQVGGSDRDHGVSPLWPRFWFPEHRARETVWLPWGSTNCYSPQQNGTNKRNHESVNVQNSSCRRVDSAHTNKWFLKRNLFC